ncbi:MAG: DNA-3-methyladenine glycosylase [Spirochaetales bacterium]|nr:DNA-3-methyladenine glycosylase [Spirochaetales bacterium]
MNNPLPLEFFLGDTRRIAQQLLGCRLYLGGCEGRIVETEAYLQNDPASHSFHGKTPRNSAMFGPPGHAYIYQIYGVHYCLNVVTQKEGIGEAILIRGIEPLNGLPQLWENRYGTPFPDAEQKHPSPSLYSLTNGPGKICQAFGIQGKERNGTSFDSPDFALSPPWGSFLEKISQGPRIGLGPQRNPDAPWRYWITGNPWVSR